MKTVKLWWLWFQVWFFGHPTWSGSGTINEYIRYASAKKRLVARNAKH